MQRAAGTNKNAKPYAENTVYANARAGCNPCMSNEIPTPAPRLQQFIAQLSDTIARSADEAALLAGATPLLQSLVAHDDWLPQALAQPHPAHYQQFLLHADPAGRFCVVSFVWGPGQGTPIHDHTVWGLIGMLRGAEEGQHFARDTEGRWQADGPPQALHPGEVQAVSPSIGDVHRVRNLLADQVSISIHVYGADIGKVQRHVFTEDGGVKPFVSGYANLPH